MHQESSLTYRHTILASYVGYITQAIVNNFAPLLYLTFSVRYGLTLDRITLLTTINFAVQLLVDLASARFVDRIGYRASILSAHVFAAAGLICLGTLPQMASDPFPALLASVSLYAVGGGLIEVLISPIVEGCPTSDKASAMSLLHSFYCWGHLGVVLISTAFFLLCGIDRWPVLACLWALVPLANCLLFSRVPIYPLVEEGEEMSVRSLLHSRTFWLLILLMACAGASEHGMSQWASAYAEGALGLSKAAGDIAGPCLFALFMGTSRAIYGRHGEQLPLASAITACAVLCAGAYLLAGLASSPAMGMVACALCGFSVGIFWPGTFSIAARALPKGGTALFALLALAGDIGCSGGPTLVGFVSGAMGGDLHRGLLVALGFPVLIAAGMRMLSRHSGA